MTREEYAARRAEIIGRYSDEIADHENAGCFGDAENARKWMRRKLEQLEREFHGHE